jgi:CRP-like cAMP-binding protein
MTASLLQSSKTFVGDNVYNEGDKIFEVFFLLKGKAGFVVTESNLTVVYFKLRRGHIFGELDFFPVGDEIPTGDRQFTAKALTDCEMVSLSKEALYELEQQYPKYIEEIFEFGRFRVKKLHESKQKAINFLEECKKEKNFDMKKIVKSKTTKMHQGLETIKSGEQKVGRKLCLFIEQIIFSPGVEASIE